MITSAYIQYTKEQLDKIGNTVIYLSLSVPDLTKTKLLKLLYILDEKSILKSGIPLLNLKFKVWKFGPVSEELFIDLSSELVMLEKYVLLDKNENLIRAKVSFDDGEFSDNDMNLMDEIISEFGSKTAKELVKYTHRMGGPWYQTAKQHQVLELLEKSLINNTEYLIDMSQLIAEDNRKLEIYNDYILAH